MKSVVKTSNVRLFAQCLAVSIVCCFVSFLNYSLVQIIGEYAIQLTVIPIFIFSIAGYRIPALFLILIGLFDDFFLNAPLGLFPCIYSFLSYALSFKSKDFSSKNIVITSFLALYIIINLTFFILS